MKSLINTLAKSRVLADLIFSIVLFAIKMLFGLKARRFPILKNRLKEKNLTVQIKLKDNSRGRYFSFRDGKIISKSGIHASPDVNMLFGSARVALDILIPPRDQLAMVNAEKSFQLGLEGPEELSCWWMETSA
jgi:trimethylamine-N-oxide reductase (cytochrome c)